MRFRPIRIYQDQEIFTDRLTDTPDNHITGALFGCIAAVPVKHGAVFLPPIQEDAIKHSASRDHFKFLQGIG